jgi:hypothetical protein
VALFDRKRRTTEYKAADSGYVSAWYLDEDYDGDCFVDCQMFFDFKKTPNIRAALKPESGRRGVQAQGNYKHGRYTAEAKQRRLQLTQWIRNQLRETRALMNRLHDLTPAGCTAVGLRVRRWE